MPILPHTLSDVQDAKSGKGLPVPLKIVNVGVGEVIIFLKVLASGRLLGADPKHMSVWVNFKGKVDF